MKKEKYISKILFILLLCGFLTGCQKAETGKGKAETALEIQNLDANSEIIIAVNVDGSSSQLPFESVWMNRSKFWGSLVFQGLLVADDNINNVKPDLCEEYIISPDGKKYTFILKDNLSWHDGENLTAEDVVWSIETCLKVQEANGFVKKGLQEIHGAKEFEMGIASKISGISVKDNDITISLGVEDPNFLASIAQLAILPKHCFEGIAINQISSCDFWKLPVGSGPYKVVTNIENREALLVVNKYYSGRVPTIHQIRYKVLEKPSTDYFDFTISSDPITVNHYEINPRYEVVKTNNLYYRYLIFNLDKRTGDNEKLLDSAKVRKALMLAIDKEGILEKIYGGAAFAISSGIPQYDSWNVNVEDNVYDPELAKQMLIEEGFDFGKTLVLTRYSMDGLSERLLEQIAECWKKVGIKVEIIPIESNSTDKLFVDADWYDVALKNLSAVDYTEWYFEYSSENQLWSAILHKRHEFDGLIQEINHATYANELQQLYSDIQMLENELVYKIPLAIVPQYVIYNKQHMYIPEITFPNLWYYYDLHIADWSIIK